jgi:NADP-dependent 3-hydroxy acid dehydrogenase YdfG
LGDGRSRRRLARGGLPTLSLNGRNSDNLSAAAQRLDRPSRIALVAGDIGEKSTGERLVANAVERFGSGDVLVNNAGIFTQNHFWTARQMTCKSSFASI